MGLEEAVRIPTDIQGAERQQLAEDPQAQLQGEQAGLVKEI
jgi:hypothetical protein